MGRVKNIGFNAPSRRSALFTTVFLCVLASAGLDVAVLNPARAPDSAAAPSHVQAPLLRATITDERFLSQPSLKRVMPSSAKIGYGKSALRDMKVWQAGIDAYKKKNMPTATDHFQSLADKAVESGLSVNDHAAVAFWTYRAYSASGDTANARRYLAKAADLPPVFYSMVARNLLEQKHILTAEVLAFPVPSWEPHSGYQVEKALLFAIMRQESGFNPNARSSAGALGLMQLMPATARAMTRGNQQLGKSLDPSVNITLGQRYLEHLMDTSHIGDNLVYLMAAYNAGPGALANWLRSARGDSDPLLFIESIPYDQTRDYVVNVMANYWIYSELLDVGRPESLQALASGQWPRYDRPQNQLITLLSRTD